MAGVSFPWDQPVVLVLCLWFENISGDVLIMFCNVIDENTQCWWVQLHRAFFQCSQCLPIVKPVGRMVKHRAQGSWARWRFTCPFDGFHDSMVQAHVYFYQDCRVFYIETVALDPFAATCQFPKVAVAWILFGSGRAAWYHWIERCSAGCSWSLNSFRIVTIFRTVTVRCDDSTSAWRAWSH